MTLLARTRLLQMTSQAFPIGAYSQSFGLEAAIDSGVVSDESSLHQWIKDVLSFSLTSYEIPVLREMTRAWIAEDDEALERLNMLFLATRESAELRSASVQMGFSMRAVLAALPNLPGALTDKLRSMQEPCLPCVWSAAACAWAIPEPESIVSYLWSWAENQVLVALKAVPLGQSAGQRVLLQIGERIAQFTQACLSMDDGLRSNFAPGLAILCSQHETQYSRLFRS
jgi:urease accessory protein